MLPRSTSHYHINLFFLSFSVFFFLCLSARSKHSVYKGEPSNLSKIASKLVTNNVYFKGEILLVSPGWKLKTHDLDRCISKVWGTLMFICLITLTNSQKIPNLGRGRINKIMLKSFGELLMNLER